MYIKEVKNKKIWKNSENKKKIIKMKKRKNFVKTFLNFRIILNFHHFVKTFLNFRIILNFHQQRQVSLGLHHMMIL